MYRVVKPTPSDDGEAYLQQIGAEVIAYLKADSDEWGDDLSYDVVKSIDDHQVVLTVHVGTKPFVLLYTYSTGNVLEDTDALLQEIYDSYAATYHSVYGSEYITAMSIINPKMCKQMFIQIELNQNNEGPIPHLHVYTHGNAGNKRNCTMVRLDIPAYSDHHSEPCKPFDKKSKKEFLKVMTSVWPKQFIFSNHDNGEYRPATGYEAAVAIWIDTFGETVKFNYDDEGYPIMPDYTLL